MKTENTNRFHFQCQPGCTRCCTQSGWVYLSKEDVTRLAAFLGVSEREFQERYVYATKTERRLRKPKHAQCPFLNENGCSVHLAKPTQCRLFPLWPELIENKKALQTTATWCPGIGAGKLVSIKTLQSSAREMKQAYPEHY
jgi:Fe-S-cluster containining protein